MLENISRDKFPVPAGILGTVTIVPYSEASGEVSEFLFHNGKSGFVNVQVPLGETPFSVAYEFCKDKFIGMIPAPVYCEHLTSKSPIIGGGVKKMQLYVFVVNVKKIKAQPLIKCCQPVTITDSSLQILKNIDLVKNPL